MLWERHNSISREEERKEEVLKIFAGISEASKRRVEAPKFPPWEPLW